MAILSSCMFLIAPDQTTYIQRLYAVRAIGQQIQLVQSCTYKLIDRTVEERLARILIRRSGSLKWQCQFSNGISIAESERDL